MNAVQTMAKLIVDEYLSIPRIARHLEFLLEEADEDTLDDWLQSIGDYADVLTPSSEAWVFATKEATEAVVTELEKRWHQRITG